MRCILAAFQSRAEPADEARACGHRESRRCLDVLADALRQSCAQAAWIVPREIVSKQAAVVEAEEDQQPGCPEGGADQRFENRVSAGAVAVVGGEGSDQVARGDEDQQDECVAGENECSHGEFLCRVDVFARAAGEQLDVASRSGRPTLGVWAGSG